MEAGSSRAERLFFTRLHGEWLHANVSPLLERHGVHHIRDRDTYEAAKRMRFGKGTPALSALHDPDPLKPRLQPPFQNKDADEKQDRGDGHADDKRGPESLWSERFAPEMRAPERVAHREGEYPI